MWANPIVFIIFVRVFRVENAKLFSDQTTYNIGLGRVEVWAESGLKS